MQREISSLYALNRGVVSRLGLARVDVKRVALAAEEQTNWMPRVLGPASLRAGLGYITSTLSNATAKLMKFIFSTNDAALLELTDSFMRVVINDGVLTRPTVATTITNGTFEGSLAGWTDIDDVGGVSTFAAPNYMQLVGNGTAYAIREQRVVNASPSIEHGIRIVIARGPVMLRIGSTSGADDYVSETALYEGTHSISIVPTGDFYIRFFSRLAQLTWVSNCTIEAAGAVTMPTPWTASDLDNVRYDQSADVVFVACSGRQQRRIERRGARPNARSWSVVLYAPNSGPFFVQNITPTTIACSAITGNTTLTASAPLFKATQVGGLFAINSVGQQVTATGAANGVFTSSIRVTGIGNARAFNRTISGNASVSTVSLQRSYDNATWADTGDTFTVDGTTTGNDGLDNQIIYYRLILTARVAPDSVTMELDTGSGSVRGVVRVTGYTSSTSVDAEVIKDLGGTTASTTWQEGMWSEKNGWPTSVVIHEGRMWWSGQNGIWGSVSDAYDSFDETVVGNAGTINRTVGSGPIDTVTWLLSLKGLLLGAQGAEYTARASSLDEPLTPASFNLKASSTQGSGFAAAIKVDQQGYFVNRSSMKVFELAFNLRDYDYSSSDLMQLSPELGSPGIVRMECQRMPDTRLHCIRSDGTVVVCVMSRPEEMLAWVEVETRGFVEDVVVLPAIAGNLDDHVYYVVRRTVNGATVRYLEKWAQESDCRGGTLSMLADSYVTYTGSLTGTVTAAHLAGEEVVIWADGQDVGTDDATTPWTQRYTLDGSGQCTLSAAVSNYVVGLGYESRFKSAKLGLATETSPLNKQKKISHIGLILADSHPRGLQFGSSFDFLDDMPLIEDGTEIGTTTQSDYDQNFIEFPGTWTTDARVCLVGQAPRSCTVLAVTIDMVKSP